MDKKFTILIIDDEESIRKLLKFILEQEGYIVDTVGTGKEALEKVTQRDYNIIVQDMKLPDIDGRELLSKLKKKSEKSLIIVITALNSWQVAVEAMRIGAFDYIRKPFENENIKAVVSRALKYQEVLKNVPQSEEYLQNIIGNSPKIQKIQEIIRIVAPTDANILIYGESGSGKELVARAIHFTSLRRENVFIPVNCGALPQQLIESELFGYTKGAFTSAIKDKKGLLEIANNGTIFFDEIGEMNLDTQVKLLRVIENKEFIPLGSLSPKKIDVRFICATNRNLEELVRRGEFREDLYYRLNVIPINLPPLRERKEDIPLLAGHFLAIYAKKFHKNIESFSEDAIHLLLSYEWPGNIRELSNIIQRAVIMCEKNIITKDILIDYIPYKYTSKINNKIDLDFPDEGINLEEKLAEIEKYYICNALKKANGNLTQASKLLKITFRSIRYKVKKYKIDIKSILNK